MILVITGVSGSGKTTIGRTAADRLGWRFCDADDLHDAASIERMRRGEPLDDRLRLPWLRRVRARIEAAREARQPLIVACSALKESYRQVLSEGLPDVRFAFLGADADVLRDRLANRRGHFASPSLLESQLATFEPAAYGLHLDAARPVGELVAAVVDYATGTERA